MDLKSQELSKTKNNELTNQLKTLFGKSIDNQEFVNLIYYNEKRDR